MRGERPRGVTVKVLDMSDLKAQALAFLQQSKPLANKATIHGGPWAIVEKTGRLFAICQEGVGPDSGVTDEDPLVLEFHGHYDDPDGDTHKHSFDMFPFATADITATDLKEFSIKEEVDLADFIRTFGSRLEGNFYSWFDILKEDT